MTQICRWGSPSTASMTVSRVHRRSRLRQLVAAGTARVRLDEAGPGQVPHDLGQEPRRDLHLLRDLAAAQEAAAHFGEREHGAGWRNRCVWSDLVA